MNKLVYLLLGSTLLLSACNDSSSSPSSSSPSTPVQVIQVAIPAQSAGAYTVVASGDTAAFGEAFYDASGNAFLALAADDRSVSKVMFAVKDGLTARAPAATANVKVEYQSSSTQGYSEIDLTKAAGKHSAIIAGQVVEFSLDDKGKLAEGATSCKLSGNLDASKRLGVGINSAISLTGCTGVGGNYAGVAYARNDLAPASFRLVAHNGTDVVDFLAFK